MQKAGFRFNKGGQKSTPITIIKVIAGLQKLRERRDEKITIKTEQNQVFRPTLHDAQENKRFNQEAVQKMQLQSPIMSANDNVTSKNLKKNAEEWEYFVAHHNIMNT